MNIFTFKKTPPIIGHDYLFNKNLSHRQWAFVIDKWSIGIERQNIYHGPKRIPIPIKGYWFGIETNWETIKNCQGYDHTYYDGDNYSIRIGPIFIMWYI
jgi:hypothetical protein